MCVCVLFNLSKCPKTRRFCFLVPQARNSDLPSNIEIVSSVARKKVNFPFLHTNASVTYISHRVCVCVCVCVCCSTFPNVLKPEETWIIGLVLLRMWDMSNCTFMASVDRRFLVKNFPLYFTLGTSERKSKTFEVLFDISFVRYHLFRLIYFCNCRYIEMFIRCSKIQEIVARHF